jgi:hypothetical protein
MGWLRKVNAAVNQLKELKKRVAHKGCRQSSFSDNFLRESFLAKTNINSKLLDNEKFKSEIRFAKSLILVELQCPKVTLSKGIIAPRENLGQGYIKKESKWHQINIFIHQKMNSIWFLIVRLGFFL